MQVGVRDSTRTWRPFVIAYYTGGENAQAGARKWVAWLAATVAIPRMLKSLARMQVLILDDWGITPLTAEQRRDLLEIVNDRHGRASGIGAFRCLGTTQTASKFPQVPQIAGKQSWIRRFAGL